VGDLRTGFGVNLKICKLGNEGNYTQLRIKNEGLRIDTGDCQYAVRIIKTGQQLTNKLDKNI